MGRKGQKRREKNYAAAHGGHSRLPPPPVLSQIDAVPSKLRKLMSLTSSLSPKPQESAAKDGQANSKSRPKDRADLRTSVMDDGGNDEHLKTSEDTDDGDDIVQNSTSEKKKKKRKRKQVNDLRFETPMENSDTRLKRRERKKKYLEEKKKKHKKAKTGEELDFPGREKIKFGEVVEAPPKLTSVPKAFKNAQNASQERIRLQTIEAYRSRKGWASRPGIQLPSPVTTPAL
ncbi:eukaryotic translation initiation factor 5B [Quercus lobata]|uniref:eukaryotic translation initiation factor 5B n=1 Tax=Quercus lobata TaxID=97700 RepID=UPI0012453179|nr:eukaryotic translation initiation factor 5B [Quercus lobata]